MQALRTHPNARQNRNAAAWTFELVAEALRDYDMAMVGMGRSQQRPKARGSGRHTAAVAEAEDEVPASQQMLGDDASEHEHDAGPAGPRYHAQGAEPQRAEPRRSSRRSWLGPPPPQFLVVGLNLNASRAALATAAPH
jgi:hypothetical protein